MGLIPRAQERVRSCQKHEVMQKYKKADIDGGDLRGTVIEGSLNTAYPVRLCS